jgi:hypothetical protein
VLDSGPAAATGTINEPFVSVTICSPSSPANCQTIDHILLDSGSYGLRIISSVLSPSIVLPQETENSSGNAIVECTPFADGYSWGPVKIANLQMAGETANALPIQIIGDPNFTSVPQSCSSTAPVAENTVATFHANGVLGVGAFAQDCGTVCVQNVIPAAYYSCDSTGACQEISISLAQQIPNPVTFFAKDNNGVIISLPQVNGAAQTVSGSLIFGVETQTNNGLGSARVFAIDPDTGYFTTTYKGVQYPDSFIDSGSNGLYFRDSSIPLCTDGSGFYCPPGTLGLSAVNTGTNGTTGTVNFQIGGTSNLLSTDAVYSLLAGDGTASTTFDWGMPFFFGRNVYYVIQDDTTTGGVGPYYAY